MLDQLLTLIQDQSQDAVVNNPAIPNENNGAVINTLVGSITNGFQEQIQSGNVAGLMGLLSGKAGQGNSLLSNPIVAGIAQSAISSLTQKLGLNQGVAGSVVSSVLPGVLGSLIGKISNSSDNSLDFNSVLGGLLGNTNSSQSGGFDLNQIGYALADGKLDMNDLVRIGGSVLSGSSNSANPSNSQPGGLDLGGLLGGLFGK